MESMRSSFREDEKCLEIMDTLPNLNMIIFVIFVKTLLDSWSMIRLRMFFFDILIMKFLSVIICIDSTNIPVINWQVRFLWSSASFKKGDKHAFSLFHDFTDESLPDHSYVISPDVQSLNHMNMNYVKHDWITNATVDCFAPRTMISFRKWSFWSYENMTNIIITIPIFFYSNDSGIHLRESNIMAKKKNGIKCSDHFVELDHEMLKWDLDGIREIC